MQTLHLIDPAIKGMSVTVSEKEKHELFHQMQDFFYFFQFRK